MGDPTETNGGFPDTNWEMVKTASEGDPPQKRKALEEICSVYWRPFYSYARSKGNSPEDAEDLTQGFFAMVLERDVLAQSNPKKGKLRSYLLRAMKNYMYGEWRNASRLKRGGGAKNLSLDTTGAEKRYLLIGQSSEIPPDKVFDRHWVATLLDHVVEKLQKRCEAEGKGDAFEVLKSTLMQDADQLPTSEAAARLGISENSVKVITHRLRRRYAKMLREAVAETLGENDDVESETRLPHGPVL